TSSRNAILLKSDGSEGGTVGMSCVQAMIVEAVARRGGEPPKDARKRDKSPRPRYNRLIPRRVPRKIWRRLAAIAGTAHERSAIAAQLYGGSQPKAPCRRRRGAAGR